MIATKDPGPREPEDIVPDPPVRYDLDKVESTYVPEPSGTRRGYDDLRRGASREHLGEGLRPEVASVADLARMAAADPSLARAHHEYRKPLYFAVRENRLDIARFLLEHDPNPMDLWVDDDPLEIARDRGYAEMEQVLSDPLETRFNASRKGEPVALALRDHDLKRMRALLDAQPELMGTGDQRSTQPIHWATMTRQIDAVDELLRRGADINARRMDGARPIHLTNGDYFYRGWRDVPRSWPVSPAHVMAHLKARGAFIDLPTACHTGDVERVRELLRQDPSLGHNCRNLQRRRCRRVTAR